MSSTASINAYIAQENAVPQWVWFAGSTAISKGQGLCYQYDYGTASESTAERYNRVELPATDNARYFAGVAARDYSAKSDGQFIEINVPGSVCQVLTKANLTLGDPPIGCTVGPADAGGGATRDSDEIGRFIKAGFAGRGAAVPLQTKDTSSTEGTTLCRLLDGPESGLVEIVTPDSDGGAATLMVGGCTYIEEATVSSDVTFTLADGTRINEQKYFALSGALTTSDFVLTVTTGIQGFLNADSTTSLGTMNTWDGSGEDALLEWNGGTWVLKWANSNIGLS